MIISAALASQPAPADTLKVDGRAFPVRPSGASVAVYAGAFPGRDSLGKSFAAYCMDIYKEIVWGAVSFTPVNGTSLFGDAKVNDPGLLANKFYSKVKNPTSSAAFRIAIREILFERAPNGYGLANNDLKAGGGSASTFALGMAQQWLTNLHDARFPQTKQFYMKYYFPCNSQNLAIPTPVPETSSYLMMLAGLGFVGFMVRRRKYF